MIWLVLFKLQRYSHVDDTAVVRSQQRGTAKKKKKEKKEKQGGEVKIYLFHVWGFVVPTWSTWAALPWYD